MRTGPILKLICGSTERGETIRISLTGCVRLVDADESGATARSIDWQRNCQTKFWHACLKRWKRVRIQSDTGYTDLGRESFGLVLLLELKMTFVCRPIHMNIWDESLQVGYE
jgi:hypothetical protein